MSHVLITPAQGDRIAAAVRTVEGLSRASAPPNRAMALPQAAPVIVRNDTGGALDAGSVVALHGPIDLPLSDTDTFNRFRSRRAFSGGSPSLPGDFAWFGVLTAPCAAGDLVPAVCSGIVEAQVYITAGQEWYQYADLAAGTTGNLVSRPAGGAEILWAANDSTYHVSGMQWAMLRLGPAVAEPMCFELKTALTPHAGTETTAQAWPLFWTGSLHDSTVAQAQSWVENIYDLTGALSGVARASTVPGSIFWCQWDFLSGRWLIMGSAQEESCVVSVSGTHISDGIISSANGRISLSIDGTSAFSIDGSDLKITRAGVYTVDWPCSVYGALPTSSISKPYLTPFKIVLSTASADLSVQESSYGWGDVSGAVRLDGFAEISTRVKVAVSDLPAHLKFKVQSTGTVPTSFEIDDSECRVTRIGD